MIDIIPFLQFGFFVPHGITAQPETIVKLTNEFKDWNLLPSTVQSLQLNNIQPLSTVMQLQLISPKRDLIIDFEPIRYNIKFNAVPEKPVPAIEEFSLKVSKIINLLNRITPYKANRLSFVTRCFCKKMSIKEIDSVNSKIFNLPTLFKDNIPVEWSTRQIIRKEIAFNGKKELINIILDINKVQLLTLEGIKNIPEDRIELGFDINTYQLNQSQRFDSDDVTPFISSAEKIMKEIEQDIQKVIYG